MYKYISLNYYPFYNHIYQRHFCVFSEARKGNSLTSEVYVCVQSKCPSNFDTICRQSICVHKSGFTISIVQVQFLREASMCIRHLCLNLSRIFALDDEEVLYTPETCRKITHVNFHRHDISLTPAQVC